MRSLHNRTLLILLLLLGVAWFGLWAYQEYRATNAATRDVDASLQQVAVSLLVGSAQSKNSTGELSPSSASPATSIAANAPGLKRYLRSQGAALPEFELRTTDHRILTRSALFPRDADPPRPGFSESHHDGQKWRFFTITDPARGLVCRVAAPEAQRQARAAVLSADFIHPLLWAVPVFGVLLWFGIWRALRPLNHIALELDRREPSDLRPLNTNVRQVPREIQSLVEILNQTFLRLAALLQQQRTFVSAAGHELRTPLAGLKVQIQVARRATDLSHKDRALVRIEGALARMQRLVEQLLTLGRVNSARKDLSTLRLAPLEIAERVLAQYRDRAQDHSIELQLTADTKLPPLEGNRDLLESMLGNLVDNALRYAPAHTAVQMSVSQKAEDIEFCVSDYGPGIPEAERERIFDGFHRLPGRSGSSGLGLAIVRAVAQAHGGEATMTARSGASTTACVRLPTAAKS